MVSAAVAFLPPAVSLLLLEALFMQKLTLSASSQSVWALETGGPGALLVSPFNLKWRFSAWLEMWRGQSFASSRRFLLQSVSSVSPRFHYRRLAFCFLPLAAILESPQELL
jgi:hypothetical protein